MNNTSEKTIPEELIPVIEYWEQHGKKTVAVAVAALVIGVGYWAFDRARAQTRQEVADALVQNYAGEMVGMSAKQAAMSAVDELQAAIDKAADPAVIPMLKLRLAKMQFAAGDYAAAEALYTELKDAAPKGFEDVPAAGLAATLEAAGKFAEAQAAYAAFLAEKGASALRLEAEIGAARCLAQLGRKEEAVKALEALLAVQDGLEAAKTAKEEAVVAAQAAFEPLKKKGLTEKDSEYVDAANKLATLRQEESDLTAALKDKDAVSARIKAAIDVVKRWEKREAVTLAAAAAQAAAAEEAKAETAEATPAPAAEEPKAAEPSAAPVEKKAE